MFFSKITIYSEFLQFQTLLLCKQQIAGLFCLWPILGNKPHFLNTEILYISNTYNHPFTFSVELHSISYFIEWSINALLFQTLIFLLVKSITTAFFCP